MTTDPGPSCADCWHSLPYKDPPFKGAMYCTLAPGRRLTTMGDRLACAMYRQKRP